MAHVYIDNFFAAAKFWTMGRCEGVIDIWNVDTANSGHVQSVYVLLY